MPNDESIPLRLTILDYFVLRGQCCVAVDNPIECENFDHLIGHIVYLNGVPAKVMAVEYPTHTPPWRAGEKIGLIIEGDNKPKGAKSHEEAS